MVDRNIAPVQITYGQLDEALMSLGFVRRKTEAFTVYREARRDAIIVLPNMPADSEVGDPHLVSVRNTVTLKGVAPADKFHSALMRPGGNGSGPPIEVYGYNHKLPRSRQRRHLPKRRMKRSAPVEQQVV